MGEAIKLFFVLLVPGNYFTSLKALSGSANTDCKATADALQVDLRLRIPLFINADYNNRYVETRKFSVDASLSNYVFFGFVLLETGINDDISFLSL